LKRLGLEYKHETFDRRNAVEGFFSRFKKKDEEVLEQIPSSFESMQSWIESFIAFYSYWKC